MSQLISEAKPFDLGNGFSWHAVIDISTTGQHRRKVIFELAAAGSRDPFITIQLDKKDRLTLSMSDHSGRRFETPRIAPAQFAGRFVWLAATVGRSGDQVRLALSIDGHAVHTEGTTRDFSGEVELVTSLGSAIDGSDPATFKVAEIVFYNRVLTDEETGNLRNYFAAKHELEIA